MQCLRSHQSDCIISSVVHMVSDIAGIYTMFPQVALPWRHRQRSPAVQQLECHRTWCAACTSEHVSSPRLHNIDVYVGWIQNSGCCLHIITGAFIIGASCVYIYIYIRRYPPMSATTRPVSQSSTESWTGATTGSGDVSSCAAWSNKRRACYALNTVAASCIHILQAPPHHSYRSHHAIAVT